MTRPQQPSLPAALVGALLMIYGCGSDNGGPGRDGGVADAGDIGANTADGGGTDIGGGVDGGNSAPCGNGVFNAGEACDDGNIVGGDGCSATCELEDDFVCPAFGVDCVRVVVCGNGRIEGDETCDDGNAGGGDGCSAACTTEDGWLCPVSGVACEAAECGDGFVAGFEACDDGDAMSGDGCSATCTLEEGFACDTPNTDCRTTDCGDGTAEGTEECDDGNLELGDGCTPFCVREPNCTDGVCQAVCGDSVVFAPEECDDGNLLDGDGCSSTCLEEPGFTCDETEVAPPDQVVLPIVLRDFLAACNYPSGTGRPEMGDSGATAPFGHPDFRCPSSTPGGDDMVETTLDAAGKPVRAMSPTPPSIESAAGFELWYRPNENYSVTMVQAMTLDEFMTPGTYRFDSSSFFPFTNTLDGSTPDSWVSRGIESTSNDSNGSGQVDFFFTSEVRYFFRYNGTETLAFSGDDDVWVFINGRLAVDIGGIHGRLDESVTLADCDDANPANNAGSCISALDLDIGGIYEAVVFQAERNTVQSQYRLTLTGFNAAPSSCESTCGDGIQTRFEQCDDGDDNGALYNGCTDTCLRTPFCGDGITQDAFGEVCDDGVNLGGSASACAPGCMQVGASCGDGVLQFDNAEQCDDGNNIDNDGCSATCTLELG